MVEIAPTSSLTDAVTPFEAGAHVAAATFLGRTPVLALGDGHILLAEIGAERRIVAHPDAGILCMASDGRRIVTGGDDGRIVATDADGATSALAHEPGGWIDALALARDGALAWSSGKLVQARDTRGEVKRWSAPTTVRGLAFLPKGYRLACAHYNAVSLWFPNAVASPDVCEWKGAHLDATVSPDGRFLVTSMQEAALHGWRLADKKNMRMTGYPAKTRSFSWSHDGQWLATSGAEACIIWPFKDKDGPMGKAPRECGVRASRVTQVAFHPRTLVVGLGYDDGWVLLCRLTDGAEILVRRSEGARDPVSAMAWDAEGRRLLFGTAGGAAGVLTLPG